MTVSFANITAVRTALPKYQHQQLGGWIGITKEFWMKVKLFGKVRRYDGIIKTPVILLSPRVSGFKNSCGFKGGGVG